MLKSGRSIKSDEMFIIRFGTLDLILVSILIQVTFLESTNNLMELHIVVKRTH